MVSFAVAPTQHDVVASCWKATEMKVLLIGDGEQGHDVNVPLQPQHVMRDHSCKRWHKGDRGEADMLYSWINGLTVNQFPLLHFITYLLANLLLVLESLDIQGPKNPQNEAWGFMQSMYE